MYSIQMHSIYMGGWGPKHRSLRLHSKHFINSAISPDPRLAFFLFLWILGDQTHASVQAVYQSEPPSQPLCRLSRVSGQAVVLRNFVAATVCPLIRRQVDWLTGVTVADSLTDAAGLSTQLRCEGTPMARHAQPRRRHARV